MEETLYRKINNGVSRNGALHTRGVHLLNEEGNPVRLRGMSTYGMQWQPQFAGEGSVRTIRDYGANLLRIAMYTDENGYIARPAQVKADAFRAVETALALDMYAVLDWHILHDNNPQIYKEQAKAFFAEAAQRFAGNPGVLYEICNEPNGEVTWERDIKPYAEEVISVIREYAPQALVLVGSSAWSQDVDEAAASPLDFPNVMYTCHFYAGTHGDALRAKIEKALSLGAPIFISEWGTTRADGNGEIFQKESQEWLDFLDSHQLSWANWSLGDKDEGHAALRPGASPEGNWPESDWSESGRFVFRRFGTNDPVL